MSGIVVRGSVALTLALSALSGRLFRRKRVEVSKDHGFPNGWRMSAWRNGIGLAATTLNADVNAAPWSCRRDRFGRVVLYMAMFLFSPLFATFVFAANGGNLAPQPVLRWPRSVRDRTPPDAAAPRGDTQVPSGSIERSFVLCSRPTNF